MMRVYFSESFEWKNTYYVDVTGYKEIDSYTGLIETELTYFQVLDEMGTELDDTSDVYNEIEEYVRYDREYETESNGWEDGADEEEIPILKT